MASEQSSTALRTSLVIIGLAALFGVGMVVKSELGGSPAKRTHAASDEPASPRSATPQAGAARPSLQPASAATPAKTIVLAQSKDDDVDPYIDKRYPNKSNPVLTVVPAFTEEDKEKAAREMFPQYRATQEAVEAQRQKLGITDPE